MRFIILITMHYLYLPVSPEKFVILHRKEYDNDKERIEKVEIESDIDTSTITYFRPILGQKIGQKELSTRERLLNLIAENPKITRRELAENLHVPASTVQFHIEKLKTEGRIERVGGARGGYWKVVN